MASIKIDFSPALHKRRRRRVSAAAAALGVVSLVALGAASWQLVSVEVAGAAVQSDMELTRESARASRAAASSAPRPGRDQVTAINQAVRQLNLPWPQIFDAVERATPEAIGLLSLTPDAAVEAVRIVAEARDTESMLDYVRQLKAQPLFDEVAVIRHEINDKDPHKPVRFEASAHWRVTR